MLKQQLMMLYKSKILIVITLMIYSIKVVAQKLDIAKLDTIYYLADTSKIPVLDRMLTINFEVISTGGKLDSVQIFRINCKCLPHGYYPTFTRHVKKLRKELKVGDLRNLKMISLPEMSALTEKDYENFYYKHVVFVIENIRERFFASEVFLTNYGSPVQ